MAVARQRRGVFVSYSRQDGEAVARDLRGRLEAARIPVWLDLDRMQGGRDWWDQVREALHQVEYLILVMTAAAVASEVVRREWRYARQQGVCVLPVRASAAVDPAILPRWMGGVHWYDLAYDEQFVRLCNDLQTRSEVRRVPFMAEPPPPGFVARDAEFRRLKGMLLSSDQQEPVAITAGLRGAGGYGKTTLARAICADDDIQNAFDDGILWVTLGEHPEPTALLNKLEGLIKTLADDEPAFPDLEAAAARLRELLSDRDVLIVIDDVWRAGDLRHFLTGGSRCARLITTRRTDTLPPSAARVTVEQMNPGEATALLAQGLPAGLAPELQRVAAQLGEWPLLLRLGNAWLRKRVVDGRQPMDRALASLGHALAMRGVAAFDALRPEDRQQAAAVTLALSFDSLTATDQRRLLELAVFEEDLKIPLPVLERFWRSTAGLDEFEVEATCQRLYDESLLVDFDQAERFVRLHDAIRNWLASREDLVPLAARHEALLSSYAAPGSPWHEVADDDYLHAHLSAHLLAAGRRVELASLLWDWRWLRIRAAAGHTERPGARGDVLGLVAEFAAFPEDAGLQLVRRALQMSTHALVEWPQLLGAQLYGRLGDCELAPARRLALQAKAETTDTLWPAQPGLDTPGPLVFTFTGHGAPVEGALAGAEDRLLLSWSRDGGIRLWDLERGVQRLALTGPAQWIAGARLLNGNDRALTWSVDGDTALWDLDHGQRILKFDRQGLTVHDVAEQAGVRAALCSRDRDLGVWNLDDGTLRHALPGHDAWIEGGSLLDQGTRALSWSGDGTLRLWDLQQGALLATLAGHTGAVAGVTSLSDPARVVSWSDDGTCRVWDLEAGRQVHVMAAHRHRVRGLRVLTGGRRALSWSDDRILCLWDLESGQAIWTLAGHEGAILGVATHAGDTRALSWSTDRTLRCWNLDSGNLVFTLSGHTRQIAAVVVAGDGTLALSGAEDGELRCWRLDDGSLRSCWNGHEAAIQGGLVLGDRRRVVTWSADGTVKLWDLEVPARPRTRARHGRAVSGIVMLTGSRQSVSWARDGSLCLSNLGAPYASRLVGTHDAEVTGALAFPDTRRLLSWSRDGTVRMWDLDRRQLVRTWRCSQDVVLGVEVLSAGGWALCRCGDGTVKLLDLAEGPMPIASLFCGGDRLDGMVVLPDGAHLLAWSGHSLKLWDLESGHRTQYLGGHASGIAAVVLRHAGQQVLSASYDRDLRLWDLQAGIRLLTLRGHRGAVTGVLLADRERAALSWSQDGTLVLWDLETGLPRQRFEGHHKPVTGVRLLSEDCALSWSEDGSLKIWLFGQPQCLRTLAAHRAAVLDVLQVSPDIALSRSADRTCMLWRLSLGQCLGVHAFDFTPTAMAVSPDGQQIVIGDSSGALHQLRCTPTDFAD